MIEPGGITCRCPYNGILTMSIARLLIIWHKAKEASHYSAKTFLTNMPILYVISALSLILLRNMITLKLFVLVALCGLLYLALNIWKAMTYWKVRGVKHFKPWPILGNFGRVLKLEKHLSFYYDELYKAFPEERMVGLYEFMTPSLLLRDTDLIEKVLVREFSTYPDHGPFLMEPKSIMYESVFAISGIRWRAIRNILLKTFTTGKMRTVFPEIVSSCQSFLASNPGSLNIDNLGEVSVRGFMNSMFGTVILPAGEEELMRNSKRIFEPKASRILQIIFLTYFPKLSDLLNMKLMPKDLDDYFRSLMETVVRQREDMSTERNDYTKVLVEMRKLGKMNVYNRENNKIDETFDVTNEIILAQAFMFFFAGLDTTSLLMLHLAFELSQAKECQQKARNEVRTVLEKYNGYSWEAVRNMKYLDQCIQETLRLHPSLQFVVRICDKDTEIEGVNIMKNTRIVIPVHSIHMDQKHFFNPEQFDPERFSIQPQKFTHLPFSDGPRVCIGKRFATMETATLFAHILDNFELSLSSATTLPLQYEPRTLFHTPTVQTSISVMLKKIS